MSATSAEPEQQIFHDALDAKEQYAVEELINLHRDNSALTQQLALDASRLVSTSQSRLQDQANAGFCKRLIRTISGETGENNLLNQGDMLQMQKVAWHYLQQLQQQNLISAQSIAVIRNNLGTMNDYIIETREFLEEAIDKINSRLLHVENNTRFNSWSLNIEANMRRYKSLPGSLLMLQLTYDFLRTHSDVALTSRDVNHLVVTLEKLGINCDEEVRLLDFMIAVIDQIDVTGIDRFRASIELKVSEHAVDSSFIQANISGLAFNALYYLSDQYEKISALIGDDELCNSDEAREKIISRIFGVEFGGLAATYTLRELISEVIGGGLVAIDLFKEVNGLHLQHVAQLEEHEEEGFSLVASLPDIQKHSFLDATGDQEARCDYVRLLALSLENSARLGPQGQEFISQLAIKAGIPEMADSFSETTADPTARQGQLKALNALLDDSDKVYCWLLDAFFLLGLEKRKIENPQVKRILTTLKPERLRENFGNLLLVLGESDELSLLDACAGLSSLTRGWCNILRYREMSFEPFFADGIRELRSASGAAHSLAFELVGVSLKATKYGFFFESFDDSILGKVGSAVGSVALSTRRKSTLAKLNQLRVEARETVSKQSAALNEANRLIVRFKLPRFEFEDQIACAEYNLDNSAGNEEWSSQIEHYVRCVERTLDAFSAACLAAQAQLELFAKGEFDQSILEASARKRRNRLEQQRQESLSKRTAVVTKQGLEYLFSIEWHQLDEPPFDPESIQQIKTDGTVWLIVDRANNFYRSEDRENWEQIHPFEKGKGRFIRKIDVVDGTWILLCSDDEWFHYSKDARSWQQARAPDRGGDRSLSPTDNIVHLDGLWIWRYTRIRDYQYTEDGILFNSTKTSSYEETRLFSTRDLDGGWEPWTDTPKLPQGAFVDCVRSLPGVGSIIAFCSYDLGYATNKKRVSALPFVKLYRQPKGWRTCTWPGEQSLDSEAIVTRIGENLLCFQWNGLLTSDKGYEWKVLHEDIRITECFHLDGISLLTSSRGDKVLYLTQDGQTFNEITLEDGRWEHLCANSQGALSVYSPNAHEALLRIGNLSFRSLPRSTPVSSTPEASPLELR